MALMVTKLAKIFDKMTTASYEAWSRRGFDQGLQGRREGALVLSPQILLEPSLFFLKNGTEKNYDDDNKSNLQNGGINVYRGFLLI